MKPNAQGCHTLKKQKPTTKDNPPLTKLGFWIVHVRTLMGFGILVFHSADQNCFLLLPMEVSSIVGNLASLATR